MGNNQDKTSKSGSNHRLSRRDFVKYGGLALGAGVGLGSLGWKHDTTPEIPLSELWKQLTGIDAHGALITAAKIDPLLSYAGEYDINGQTPAPVIEEGISDLLAAYIESEYQSAPASDLWEEIKQRIDYTDESLTPVLTPILGGRVFLPHGLIRMDLTPTGRRVRREIVRNRRRLLFKPNLVTTEVLGFDGSGRAPQNQYGCPGQGVQACTDWSFLAALMRWFHDNLELSYYQMAFGEASPLLRMSCQMVAAAIPDFTPESLLEGRLSAFDAPDGGPGSPIYYGGYPFFFVRKYLSERHDPTHQDDPMKGHLESQQGVYVPPGAATHLLPAYNLSNAEAHTTDARGRTIAFPHGAQYTELTIHKAIVGAPNDASNYPGCVLINVPKLKIHSIMAITNAIKNLGIGLWSTESGSDADPNTPDYKYSTPSTESFPGCVFPPMASLKARVYPLMGIVFNMMANGQMERSQFHMTLKRIKYSEPAWNSLGAGNKTDLMPMTLAVTLASQPQTAEMVDQFFGNNPYGRASDGTSTWPSLQWARFLYEAGAIRGGHDWVQQYASQLGYTFTLLLPSSLPYFPDAISPFMGLGLDGVEETAEQEEMFVAIFYDETGEEVERW